MAFLFFRKLGKRIGKQTKQGHTNSRRRSKSQDCKCWIWRVAIIKCNSIPEKQSLWLINNFNTKKSALVIPLRKIIKFCQIWRT
ncbi:hypothetical protein GQ55_3G301900 [Panicum hallii var. hallii]|uniref:Uncharacterized protein n=1 Tax=Panicum hallii var. hallii TaxID=1504633 RepID=A0A2T7EEW9_9POAL|nr:hypothetical protein GQ55_3G301900 [Panicum hallii var. hallii]